MPELCFSDEERRIASYYLTETRDEASKKLGVSTGTVSDKWKKLESLLGPEAKNLKEIAQKIRKSNKPIGEVLRAAELL